MAINKLSKSNRLLQSRRYTHDSFTDSQEAFTSVLDINANEVYVDQSLIPTASIPYSGSAQSGLVYSVGGQNVMQYYWRQPLTRSNLSTGSAQNEVWFFLNPSGSNAGIGAQLIDSTQQTNFISPKYATSSLANATTEDTTTGYLAKVFVSNAATASGVVAGDAISVNNYTFDYKTGVLQFTSTALAPTSAQYVYVSVYQYKGRTLTDSITNVSSSIAAISASVGGGGAGSLSGRVASLETTSASVNISISNLNTYSSSVSNSIQQLNLFTSSTAALSSLNSFTASAGIRLTNLETTSASVSSSIGSLNTYTASVSNSVQQLSVYTSSAESKFTSIAASTSSLNAFTSSAGIRLTNLETTSASVNISVTNLNTYSASVSNSLLNLNAFSASENTKSTTLATYTGSVDTKFASVGASTASLNSFTSSILAALTASGANITTNGSLTVKGDLIIQGSSSVVNSTTIQLGDNIIELNGTGVANGGLLVKDPTGGSTISGSLLWDSTLDYWKGGTAGNELKLLRTGGDGVVSGSGQISIAGTSDYTSLFTGIASATASLNTFSASANISITNLNTYTGSISDPKFVQIGASTSSLNTFTASLSPTSNVVFNNVSASAVTSSFNISAPFVSGSTTTKRIAFRDTTGKLELVPSASVVGDFVQWDGGSFIMSNIVDGGSF